jgi:hypothetical protein
LPPDSACRTHWRKGGSDGSPPDDAPGEVPFDGADVVLDDVLLTLA